MLAVIISGNYVEFAKSTNFEVIGKRELSLFSGIVRGQYYVIIIIEDNIDKTCHVFYNGGGYFVNAENAPNTKVMRWPNLSRLKIKIYEI